MRLWFSHTLFLRARLPVLPGPPAPPRGHTEAAEREAGGLLDILGRAPSFLFLHPQFLVSSRKGASCKVSYWHETSPTLPPCPGENRKGVRWLLQNHCTLWPLLKARDLLRGSETPCECRRVTIASAVFLRDCWLEDVWGWVSGGGRCEGQVFCGWFLSPAQTRRRTHLFFTLSRKLNDLAP